MPPRVDPFDKLILIVRGRIQIAGPVGDAVALVGSVVFIPGGVSHRVKDLMPSTLFTMCFARGFEVARPDVRDLIASLGEQISVWDRLPFLETLVPLRRQLISEQTGREHEQRCGDPVGGSAVDCQAGSITRADRRRVCRSHSLASRGTEVYILWAVVC